MLFKNRIRKYKEDVILRQERFEPGGWVEPLEIQIQKLKEYFPSIIIPDLNLFKKKKGYSQVVIPKISFLSKYLKVLSPYDNIGVLIEDVCSKLMIDRNNKFTHYRHNELGRDRILSVDSIVSQREEYEINNLGDVLILNVDMGNKYAGWTPRRARASMIINKRELPLFTVDICWIVLLNPSRFSRNIDLSVDSVAEIYQSLDRGWVTNLFMYFRGGKLELGYRWSRRAYFDCGAVYASV